MADTLKEAIDSDRTGTSARQLYRWLDREGLDPEAFRAP